MIFQLPKTKTGNQSVISKHKVHPRYEKFMQFLNHPQLPTNTAAQPKRKSFYQLYKQNKLNKNQPKLTIETEFETAANLFRDQPVHAKMKINSLFSPSFKKKHQRIEVVGRITSRSTFLSSRKIKISDRDAHQSGDLKRLKMSIGEEEGLNGKYSQRSLKPTKLNRLQMFKANHGLQQAIPPKNLQMEGLSPW